MLQHCIHDVGLVINGLNIRHAIFVLQKHNLKVETGVARTGTRKEHKTVVDDFTLC